jgi:hypothetical protein
LSFDAVIAVVVPWLLDVLDDVVLVDVVDVALVLVDVVVVDVVVVDVVLVVPPAQSGMAGTPI